LWLLRDVPALLGVLRSFWSLVICAMINDRKAIRADNTGKAIRDHIAALLAHAEANLDFALWRQAYRRIGWHPRAANFHLIAPTTRWADTQLRLQNYCRAFGNMQEVVDAYVEHLRAQHRISQSDLVANGSTDTALCAAAHHELVGTASIFSRHAQFALILSSDRRELPSKDERGHQHARGPPLHTQIPKSKGRALQVHNLRERGLVPCG
jgi:hypothetical protein